MHRDNQKKAEIKAKIAAELARIRAIELKIATEKQNAHIAA